MGNQIEITEKRPLLDDNGNLANAGYAKKLNWEYDRGQIKAKKARIKEWEYYSISNGEYSLGITIADIGYAGTLTVSVVDYITPAQFSATAVRLFSMGKLNMPADLDNGEINFKKGKIWASIKIENGVRHLTGEYPNADDRGTLLSWDITLGETPKEYMAIATPFEKDKHFYLNAKVNCMRVEGGFKLNDMYCRFEKHNSLAVLDWGRGVWPYKNIWYWASLSTALDDGRLFGFNFGYGFGDTENATENMLLIDGKAHKINSNVTFTIGGDVDGKPRFIEPWTIQDEEGRVELCFTPIIDKYAPFDIKFLQMKGHQVFGWYDGKCILDDGTEIKIDHKIGFAEKVVTKW
ncbi:MAG: DUF2804 domain-containing protein [Clostridia bacterium]|nr:DUF2804 domain-containing protein [Clostridia bacterium]